MGSDKVPDNDDNDKKLMVFCYYCYKNLMKNITDTLTPFRPYANEVINKAITLTDLNTEKIYKKYGFLLKYLLLQNKTYKNGNKLYDFPYNIVYTCMIEKDGDLAKTKPYCIEKYEFLRKEIFNKNINKIKDIVNNINTCLELNIDINNSIMRNERIVVNIILIAMLYADREYYALQAIKYSFKPFIYYDELIKNTSDEDINYFLNILRNKYNEYVKKNKNNNKDMTDFFKDEKLGIQDELIKIKNITFQAFNHKCIELRF